MNRGGMGFLILGTVIFGMTACHSNGSHQDMNRDTPLKTSSDTSYVQGTPGKSGTEPRPVDTTQRHRDSLNRERHISDTSGQSSSPPK